MSGQKRGEGLLPRGWGGGGLWHHRRWCLSPPPHRPESHSASVGKKPPMLFGQTGATVPSRAFLKNHPPTWGGGLSVRRPKKPPVGKKLLADPASPHRAFVGPLNVYGIKSIRGAGEVRDLENRVLAAKLEPFGGMGGALNPKQNPPPMANKY